MGIAERREREREALRTQIVEAARDILSEQGLDGLSMRAIAERIEYSPATIYLYFKDKTELIREVVAAGFERQHEYMVAAMRAAAAEGPLEEYGAMGRAYARFALENTAYFRVMFELPGVAQIDVECPHHAEDVVGTEEPTFASVVDAVRRAREQGQVEVEPEQGALIGWGLMHGLTSLFLSGHLRESVQTPEQFMELIEAAQRSLYHGWRADGAAPEAGTAAGAGPAAGEAELETGAASAA